MQTAKDFKRIHNKSEGKLTETWKLIANSATESVKSCQSSNNSVTFRPNHQNSIHSSHFPPRFSPSHSTSFHLALILLSKPDDFREFSPPHISKANAHDET